jgi:hypothetical protein
MNWKAEEPKSGPRRRLGAFGAIRPLRGIAARRAAPGSVTGDGRRIDGKGRDEKMDRKRLAVQNAGVPIF